MNNISGTASTPPSPKERILYLDYLRVFAILAVIALHISAQNWHETEVTSYQWQIFNFGDSISRWCVAVFVMISGALFLERRHSIRTIYTKYILRLVTAALFWGFLYALILGGGPWKLLLYTIKGRYHMWFIPMIIGMYISVPIIQKLAESRSVTRYFLAVSFVFAFLLPQLTSLADDFGGNALQDIFSAVNSNITDMDLQLVLGYTCYFLLGYYLNHTELGKKQQHMIYLLGLAGFAFTVIADSFLSLRAGTPKGTYYGDFTVNVLLESVSVFVLLKYHCPDSERLNNLVILLSKYSFGAYLVHVMFLETLEKTGLTTLTFTPLISMPLIFIIVAALSFSVSAAIHRIPVLKKYVV